jgi:hypothetical protein
LYLRDRLTTRKMVVMVVMAVVHRVLVPLPLHPWLQ